MIRAPRLHSKKDPTYSVALTIYTSAFITQKRRKKKVRKKKKNKDGEKSSEGKIKSTHKAKGLTSPRESCHLENFELNKQ